MKKLVSVKRGVELDLEHVGHHRISSGLEIEEDGEVSVPELWGERRIEPLGPLRRREDPVTARENDVADAFPIRFEGVYLQHVGLAAAKVELRDVGMAVPPVRVVSSHRAVQRLPSRLARDPAPDRRLPGEARVDRPPQRPHLQGWNRPRPGGSSGHNPRCCGLLGEFEERIRIPVLLNSSFNEREPLVHTQPLAIDCFARTRMDARGVDPSWIERPAERGAGVSHAGD
jgi:hypothetical protein